MEAYCCVIECADPAVYEIRTTYAATGGPASPDPYSDDTHSCEAHIGALLGKQPDCELDDSQLSWEVRLLPLWSRIAGTAYS